MVGGIADGVCRNDMYEFEKDGVKQQGLRLGLYAYGFNGWLF